MLTGLTPASEGSVKIFGKDLFRDMDEVRKLLGVCPQYDILFEMLTPEEHLEIFSGYKDTKSENKK